MKVLLYQKNEKYLRKSGIGRAMKHQMDALDSAGVSYTTNSEDTYDLVHINTVDLSGRKMAKKAKKQGKKVIYHAHSTEEDFKNSFIFSNQISPLFKKWIIDSYLLGDVLLTPTPYSKRILESYGIKKPIIDISNGISLKKYAYNENKVKKYRNFFDIKDDEKVVISVGLYFERKGLHDFIELASMFPKVKFIWFGHTPRVVQSSVIKKAIKNKTDNVILPGYISGDIIEGAYLDADVFFFPSYEETEGIVVLEAFASKCQVLLRDIPVYKPWVVKNKHAYFGKDSREFYHLLKGLLDGSLPSTVDDAYNLAEERSIDAIGNKLKTIYRGVVTNV